MDNPEYHSHEPHFPAGRGVAPVPEPDGPFGTAWAWLLRSPGVVLLVCVPLLIVLVVIWAMMFALNSFFNSTYIVPGGVTVNAMAWSPEGERLAVCFSGGNLEVLDWKTSEPVINEKFSWYDKMSRLQWSPDGEWIAGVTASGLPRPVTISLATGNGYQPFGRAGEPEAQTKVYAWTPPPPGPNRQTRSAPELAVAGISDLFVQRPGISVDVVDWRFPKYERTLPGIDGPGSRGLPFQVSCLAVLPDPANPGSHKARVVTMREEESVTVQDRPLLPAVGADRIVKVFHRPIPMYGRFDLLLSPGGSRLAAVGYEETGELIHADIWDLVTSEKLRTLQLTDAHTKGLDLEIMWKDGQNLHEMAWSKDGKLFAGAFRLNTNPGRNQPKEFVGLLLAWWDVETGKMIATKWAWKLEQEDRAPWQQVKGIYNSFGQISWSPTLDKVALVRPLSAGTANGRITWDRQMICVVHAPQEVTGVPEKGKESAGK